jgi:AcrR family transcriptional regulator
MKNTDSLILELFEFIPRKGDLKKIEIIKATIHCLAHLGIENTTFEAIATEIDTRRAHIAYHFKDKNLLFLACIKYILATYQQVSIENIKESSNGENILEHFVKAPFIWAKKYPDQLTVMFLLYYYCRINKTYLKLHTQVRNGGHSRIHYIITKKLKIKASASKLSYLSWSILNIISGNLLNAATTDSVDLEKAKDDTWRIVKSLVLD